MKVRKATKNDLPEICQQAQVALGNKVWFSKKFLFDVFKKFYETTYVFEDKNGRIGGTAIFENCFQGKAWTWMIYVRKDLQKQGYGTDFLDALSEELKQNGYRKMYADITVGDTSSTLFHLRNGFKVSGIFPEWHGKRKDALILHKNLR